MRSWSNSRCSSSFSSHVISVRLPILVCLTDWSDRLWIVRRFGKVVLAPRYCQRSDSGDLVTKNGHTVPFKPDPNHVALSHMHRTMEHCGLSHGSMKCVTPQQIGYSNVRQVLLLGAIPSSDWCWPTQGRTYQQTHPGCSPQDTKIVGRERGELLAVDTGSLPVIQAKTNNPG